MRTAIRRDELGRFALGSQRDDVPLFERYEIGENGCWVWIGGELDRGGYGRCKWNGRTDQAHRVYYQHFKGPIPRGLEIHHLCRNRACVNPDHLKAVTRAENTQDGGAAKLTPDDVREIRRVMDDLCRRFNMSPSGLRMIADRRTWKGIEN